MSQQLSSQELVVHVKQHPHPHPHHDLFVSSSEARRMHAYSLQLSVETEKPGIHLFMENRSGFHGNDSFVEAADVIPQF
jgi:hypothetical protein